MNRVDVVDLVVDLVDVDLDIDLVDVDLDVDLVDVGFVDVVPAVFSRVPVGVGVGFRANFGAATCSKIHLHIDFCNIFYTILNYFEP